jgi:putative serine protease PepD
MNRPGKTGFAALTAALAVGAAGGAAGYSLADRGGGASASGTTAATAAAQPTANATKNLSINQIYDQAGPGVVDITVATSSSSGSSGGFPFGGGGGGSTATAEGSGFVYDAAGHIVTNNHVVEGETSIKVEFSNGKTYDATLVGTDPSTDLAVLKVDAPASQLHPLSLASSSGVEVGDGVVAIGSPFGLSETVTAGIVSAVNRQIDSPSGATIPGAIQTDAAINHGNSGGPLLDFSGKVVGVNAQIESDSGDNAGVGFAIPSDTVKSVVSQIVSGGQVQHAYLGVSIEDSNGQGAAVQQVQSGSPAANAGLAAGDVITAVDGDSVRDAASLTAAVAGRSPGDKVTLTYTRNGSTKTASVVLGTRPSSS